MESVSVSVARAPLPSLPSPTLTNPDMILPWEDDSRSSTPSPPPQGMRPAPQPPRGENALHSHPPDNSHFVQSRSRHDVTQRDPSPAGTFGHGRPLSDIQESDIAPPGRRYEESYRGRRRGQSPPLASSPTLANAPVRQKQQLAVLDGYSPNSGSSDPSPITPSNMIPIKLSEIDEENQMSRINGTTEERGEEKDDQEKNPDEEGDGYDESFAISERLAKDLRRMSNGTILEDEEENAGQNASIVLSKRAESILANAKLRLTTMEGNLSRARTSLLVSPSPSAGSSLSNSPYSPKHTPNSSADLKHHQAVGVTPSKHRLLNYSPFNSAGSPNHARVFSETSVPSSLYTTFMAKGVANPTRSASALGASPRSNVSQEPKSKDRLIRRSQSGKHTREDSTQDQPFSRNYLLSGSPTANTSSPPAPSASQPPSNETPPARGLGSKAFSSHESFSSPLIGPSTITPDATTGLSRSRSTIHMRDVRDQVNDLKGRISSLKQRTKEDSLKRRSLQSLRTPSPFTAAEQWYSGANGFRESGLSANAGTGTGTGTGSGKVERWAETGNPYEKNRVEASNEQETPQAETEPSTIIQPEEQMKQPETELELALEEPEEAIQPSEIDDASEDFQSIADEPSEEMPDEYDPEEDDAEDAEDEETVDTPEEAEEAEDDFAAPAGERHEDRADAFDYEHFYLHSGMGHYSRQARGRGRQESDSDSVSSDSADSVETARGIDQTEQIVPQDESPRSVQSSSRPASKQQHSAQPSSHQRQNSTDSVSTVATFATAAEDRSVDGSSDEDSRSTPLPTTPLHFINNVNHGNPNDQNGWFSASAVNDRPRTPRSRGATINSNENFSPPSPDRPASAIKITDSSPYPPPPSNIPSQSRSTLAPQLNHSASSLSLSGSSCPGTPTPPAPAVQLSQDDRLLLERVLESLRQVSMRLYETASAEAAEGVPEIFAATRNGGHSRNASDSSTASGRSEIGMLRRRLDDARRILDGERHGEVL
ncbi:MAG: hypothetical protein M4579_001069 [Chaenotheca gracillima]|nr:MAG: hypothetical protein M4579_001069 [Chaenotheca gracillima]